MHAVEYFLNKLSWEYVAGSVLLWLTVVGSILVTFYFSNMPRTWKGLWHHAVPPGTLSSRSARADVGFWITRKIVNMVMIVPTAAITAGIAWGVHGVLGVVLPGHAKPSGDAGLPLLLLFTVVMFLAYDFAYYVYHYAQHKVPVFWELHKVHHSAEIMVGFTKDRIHPLDEFMNHVWDGLVTGPIYGVFSFFLLNPVELTFFGLNIYMLRNVMLMMDAIRHTHYRVSFGPLNHVLLCPFWHQLHHSSLEPHLDKNFGLALSIWDRLFGTLVVPAPDEKFEFGLTHGEHVEYQTVARLYYVPLVKIWHRIVAVWPKHREGAHDHI